MRADYLNTSSLAVAVKRGIVSTLPFPGSVARALRSIACSAIPTLGVAAILPWASLGAQVVAGTGSDAIAIPRGAIRFRVGAEWNSYSELFGSNGSSKTSLLNGLNSPALGIRALPQLTAAQQAIRALSARSDFTISLGALQADAQVRQNIAPLALDFGVTRRLAIGVVVPYVESRITSNLILNRTGNGATVGLNPTRGANGASARATNAQLLREIATARSALAAEITRCATPTATGCDAVRANAAAAQQLLTRSQETEQALAILYGDSVSGGSYVVPITGSQVQTAITDAIKALRTDFTAFGVTAIGETSLPLAATTVLGTSGLRQIASDTSLGLGYAAFGNTRRAGIGDIDLTATFILLNGFGSDPRARFNARSRRTVRSALTAGWRFGTANADRTEDPFDVPTGEGANAVLVGNTTDIVFGRRFWISGTVRVVKPLQDEVATVFPLATDSTVFAPFAVGQAQRQLGMRMQVEVLPRMSLGEFFGVAAGWNFRRNSADEFTLLDGPDVSRTDAARTMVTPTRTLHSITVGFSYSSLASYARGRSRLPVEVILEHSQPITGSGAAPVMSVDRLAFRIYTGFPRR